MGNVSYQESKFDRFDKGSNINFLRWGISEIFIAKHCTLPPLKAEKKDKVLFYMIWRQESRLQMFYSY